MDVVYACLIYHLFIVLSFQISSRTVIATQQFSFVIFVYALYMSSHKDTAYILIICYGLISLQNPAIAIMVIILGLIP